MGKSLPQPAGNSRWARWINNSTTPIFLIDRDRRLQLFNLGCTLWTGWPADDVIARVCDYVTEPDSQSREAVLSVCAPPPEVWQGRPVEIDLWLPHRSEPPRQVRIRFQPLLDAEGRTAAVWGEIAQADAWIPAATPSAGIRLHADLAALRQAVYRRYGDDGLIARTPAMLRVLSRIECAGQAGGTVLLVGERGTGREHLARMIHRRGSDGQRAFVPLDCRKTPGSELKRTLKRLDSAVNEIESLRPGTVFFRGIDASPPDFQERLADWLTQRPAGEPPRLIASADRALEPLVEQEQYHRELYYLLTTLMIDVPPLRQRGDDVLTLAQHFLESQNRNSDRQHGGFTEESLVAIRRYNWPGNVTELKTVVESAAAQSADDLIGPDAFPLSFRVGRDAQRLGPRLNKIVPLEQTLEQVEREQIERALEATRRNISQAAELLGLTRAKLYRRMSALAIALDEREVEPPSPPDHS